MQKISVIIPCYNVEKTIDRLFLSIEAQTFGMDNLEIICVDDKSTDNTLNILEEWESKYNDIVCIVALSENGRQGKARNIGLEYASCEWVTFLDADDWIEKDYFELLYSKAVTGKYDVVACDMGRDSSEGLSYFSDRRSNLIEGEIKADSETERKSFFHTQALKYTACCRLIRKDLLINNRIYFTEGVTYEDTFWGPLLNLYVTSAYIFSIKLYHYYVNNSSTVLVMDSDHHLDLMTNQELLWQEYKKRGFMEVMREELEFEYVYSYALAFWKVIVLRYQEPSYSKYRLLCANIKSHIPEIESNKYVKHGELSELYLLMLRSLLIPLNKEQFNRFSKQIKRIGL
jgi:glycosyltransferase involved in cell wall biosynthesis